LSRPRCRHEPRSTWSAPCAAMPAGRRARAIRSVARIGSLAARSRSARRRGSAAQRAPPFADSAFQATRCCARVSARSIPRGLARLSVRLRGLRGRTSDCSLPWRCFVRANAAALASHEVELGLRALDRRAVVLLDQADAERQTGRGCLAGSGWRQHCPGGASAR
jgi:hypothetical protein